MAKNASGEITLPRLSGVSFLRNLAFVLLFEGLLLAAFYWQEGGFLRELLGDQGLLGLQEDMLANLRARLLIFSLALTPVLMVLSYLLSRRHRRLQHALEKANRQQAILENERAIVEDILAKIRSAEAFDNRDIRFLTASVETTAGDLLLSARCFDGERYFLLGDFTGHGLPSAIASPTVADIFYSMTRKGMPPLQILHEINTKLVEKLPPRLFFAACFIAYKPWQRLLRIWNAGLPDLLLFRENWPHHRVPSMSVPLGIVETLMLEEPVTLDCQTGDTLYVFTDGIVEVPGMQGELFGIDRLERAVGRILRHERSLESLLEILEDFQGSLRPTDDITLLEVAIK